MCFVFSNILALFRAFFEFSRGPPGSPQSGNYGPGRIHQDPVPRPSVCDVKKLEFWLYFMHLSIQFEFVLSSFSKFLVCFQ